RVREWAAARVPDRRQAVRRGRRHACRSRLRAGDRRPYPPAADRCLAAGAMRLFRVPLALAVAATLVGCAVAARTGMIRQDVLTDAQLAFTQMEINRGDMTIVGTVDRDDTTYASGQPITLSATLSKDGFVAILRVLPNGATTLLFPNSAHPIAY